MQFTENGLRIITLKLLRSFIARLSGLKLELGNWKTHDSQTKHQFPQVYREVLSW